MVRCHFPCPVLRNILGLLISFFSPLLYFFSLHKSNRLPLSFLNLRLPLFPFAVLLHHALLRFSSSYPRDLPFNYFPSSSVLPYASFALTHSLPSLIYFFSYSCYDLCSSNYSLSFLISHSSFFCLLLSFIRFSLFYLSIFRVCFLNSYDFIFLFLITFIRFNFSQFYYLLPFVLASTCPL